MSKFTFKNNENQILDFIEEMSRKEQKIAQTVVQTETISIVKIGDSKNLSNIKFHLKNLQNQESEKQNGIEEEQKDEAGPSRRTSRRLKREVTESSDIKYSETECMNEPKRKKIVHKGSSEETISNNE